MNSLAIDDLLHDEECSYLDFKRDQYKFDGATKVQKSELLKDLLSFANSGAPQDRFIMVGVEEVTGGKSRAVGIARSLDEAKLQQFVNSKTQRPLEFSYREIVHDSVRLGLFRVPVQRRPIYLPKRYGIVESNYVYLRRGSSTAVASPDEIGQIFLSQVVDDVADVDMFLYEPFTKESVSEAVAFRCVSVTCSDTIPDFKSPRYVPTGIVGFESDDNVHYWRQKFHHHRCLSLFKQIYIAIKNKSQVETGRGRIMLKVPIANFGTLVIPSYELPKEPSPRTSLVPELSGTIQEVLHGRDIEKTSECYKVSIEFESVLPGDILYIEEPVIMGFTSDGLVSVSAQVFAKNLRTPLNTKFNMDVTCETRVISAQEIQEL